SLKDRVFHYPSCGFSLDRDLNASINIHRGRAHSWSRGALDPPVAKPCWDLQSSSFERGECVKNTRKRDKAHP
ncbi:transposase, partial [Helicobacter mehlei]|uniref:transposase n=1 Tax=Helicobacter mehlei TaxID=2316080 RepID=UPI001F2DF004